MLRGRYLWAALAVLLLALAGFYVTRGTGTTPAPISAGVARSAPGSPTSPESPESPGSPAATATPGSCGSPAGTAAASGDSLAAGSAGAPCSLGSARIVKMPATVAAASGLAGTARTARTAAPAAAPGKATAHATHSSAASPSAPGSNQQASASGSNQQGTPADQVLALINRARAQAGLPALTFSAGLDKSASAHNLKMAGGCGLSHQCPGEPAIGARETAAGVDWTAAGENIGEAGPEPDTTSEIAKAAVGLTQDMLNEKPPDDGHRRNILSSSFHHIGIAVYEDSSGTVWMTQDFSN